MNTQLLHMLSEVTRHPLPSHFLQLFLGYPRMFLGQNGHKTPIACSAFAPWSPLSAQFFGHIRKAF